MLRWKLSYDGTSDHEWLSPAGKWVRLELRYRQPWNPTKFNTGVYPNQIAGVGTVHVEYGAHEGFPPPEAIRELELTLVDSYFDHLAHANKIGCPADPIPDTKLTPVMFSMERLEFVTVDGRPAHCQAPGFDMEAMR